MAFRLQAWCCQHPTVLTKHWFPQLTECLNLASTAVVSKPEEGPTSPWAAPFMIRFPGGYVWKHKTKHGFLTKLCIKQTGRHCPCPRPLLLKPNWFCLTQLTFPSIYLENAILFCFFDTWSHFVVRAGPKLMNLLAPHPLALGSPAEVTIPGFSVASED